MNTLNTLHTFLNICEHCKGSLKQGTKVVPSNAIPDKQYAYIKIENHVKRRVIVTNLQK
jgi:hypothetical protein